MWANLRAHKKGFPPPFKLSIVYSSSHLRILASVHRHPHLIPTHRRRTPDLENQGGFFTFNKNMFKNLISQSLTLPRETDEHHGNAFVWRGDVSELGNHQVLSSVKGGDVVSTIIGGHCWMFQLSNNWICRLPSRKPRFQGKIDTVYRKLLLAHFPLNDIFELIRGCKLHGFSFVIAITVIQND